MNITKDTTVAEIAAALPSSVRVFERHHIDFCCGGKQPLGDACRDHGLALDTIADEIAASTQKPADSGENWGKAPLAALTAHIVRTYHDALREELPRLETMAVKVAQAHGRKDARLERIAEIVDALSDDLQSHMRKEELVLFPAIDALEARGQASMRIDAPIAAMEHDHDHAGELLAELRWLTSGWQPPQWGCATLRALYAGLSELEAAMHLHVHLENNVLFPRALRLLGAA